MTCSRLAASALGLVLLFAAGCTPSPQANPVFNDATIYAFVEFDNEEPANLAFAVRELEREIYLAVDVEAAETLDRALAPNSLSFDDISTVSPVPDVYPEGFDHPAEGDTVDPSRTLGIAVSAPSDHDPSAHVEYILLADQVPVEPSSPDHYDRTFDDGVDCFADRSCEFLRTTNDLTKDNALMTVSYILMKEYRWVDLNLPDPAEVPEGDPIVNEGEERWAVIARAWDPDVAIGEGGNTAIYQSYTIEVWIPRDGGGFVRDGSETNADDGDWTADSSGGGLLRMMTLWSESSFGDAGIVETATRNGMDDIFEAQEAWLNDG
jgi:hypothetical protein